jgi:hypothetical protein
MTEWEDKRYSDFTSKDKIEMIESFAGALSEFYHASKTNDTKFCSQIAQVLLQSFSVAVLDKSDDEEVKVLLEQKAMELMKSFGAKA